MKQIDIIYFHGLIGSNTNWKVLVQHIPFANHIFPKLDYLEDLSHQVENLKVGYKLDVAQKRICVANSLGCLVALKMAERFDKLILVAPPYKFFQGSAILSAQRIESLKKELFFDTTRIPENELNLSIDFWLNEYRKRVNIKKLRNLKKELLEYNFVDAYNRYQNKIHFVLGKEDKLVPIDEFESMRLDMCPESECSIVEECAHAVQMEKPYELALIVNKYVQGGKCRG